MPGYSPDDSFSFSDIEELRDEVRNLKNKEALRGDKRLLFFGAAAESSKGDHSAADKKIDSWYQKKCLICGVKEGVSRAHLVSGKSTTDFSPFGPPTYANALDVKSARNFIPLCGSLGEQGSCHDAFDKFYITIVRNELTGTLFCYCIAPVEFFPRRAKVHLKELNLHSEHRPYSRLLVWHARKCYAEHSYWVDDEAVGKLGSLVDLSDTASARPAVDDTDDIDIDSLVV